MEEQIRNNEEDWRYELEADGAVAELQYDLEDGRVVFTHTAVPRALEGRGIAGRLVTYALDDARRRNLQVVAQCPYVAKYIQKHPEYADLVRS